MAYVGYRLRGGWGALATASAVLLPSFLLVVGLTMFYLQAGEVPAVHKVFAGFIPAVVAIITAAATRMSKKAIKGWREVAIAGVAAILLKTIGGFYITLVVILAAGITGWILFRNKLPKDLVENSANQVKKVSFKQVAIPLGVLAAILLLSVIPLPVAEDSLVKLFTTFSGMSLILFGGGYVFIPMIQEVVVNGYGWVTQAEFSNAIAMGQITPGPILISAAFIGYVVKGFVGAFVSTVAIFFPPALLMVTLSHLLDNIKQSIVLQAALRGIRPAVIGMIFTAAIVVAQTAEMATVQMLVASLAILAASLVAIWKFRLEVVLIIPAAGILGLLLY